MNARVMHTKRRSLHHGPIRCASSEAAVVGPIRGDRGGKRVTTDSRLVSLISVSTLGCSPINGHFR